MSPSRIDRTLSGNQGRPIRGMSNGEASYGMRFSVRKACETGHLDGVNGDRSEHRQGCGIGVGSADPCSRGWECTGATTDVELEDHRLDQRESGLDQTVQAPKPRSSHSVRGLNATNLNPCKERLQLTTNGGGAGVAHAQEEARGVIG